MDLSSILSKGIPEKVASFLISYFDGDMEKVYFVLSSLKKDVVIIKLKFSFSIYLGIALMFINTKSKTIELVKSYVSQSLEISKINIESPWKEIIKNVSDNLKNLQIDPDLSKRAEYIFSSDSKFTQTLIKLVTENKQYLDIKRFLYTYAPLILSDPNAIIRFSMESIDIFSFYRFLKDSNLPIPEHLKFIEENTLSSISISDIAIQPVLSPIDGTPISSLKIGDEITVKVLDTDEISRCFLKGDGIINAKITSIKPLENERNLITVEIGPGFLGNFVIKSDVKIKKSSTSETYQPEVSTQAKINYQEYLQKEPQEDKTLYSREIEERIEREKDSSLVFWIINLSIIGFGIALIAIILLSL